MTAASFIMIIGKEDGNVDARLTPYFCSLGSAKKIIGTHSRPNLGPEVLFYDGPDQQLQQEVYSTLTLPSSIEYLLLILA